MLELVLFSVDDEDVLLIEAIDAGIEVMVGIDVK